MWPRRRRAGICRLGHIQGQNAAQGISRQQHGPAPAQAGILGMGKVAPLGEGRGEICLLRTAVARQGRGMGLKARRRQGLGQGHHFKRAAADPVQQQTTHGLSFQGLATPARRRYLRCFA